MLPILSGLLFAGAIGFGVYGALVAQRTSVKAMAQVLGGTTAPQVTEPAAATHNRWLPRVLLAALGVTLGALWLQVPLAAVVLGAVGFFVEPLVGTFQNTQRKQKMFDALPLAVSHLATEVAAHRPLPDALQATAITLAADPKGKPLADVFRQTAAAAYAQGAEVALSHLAAHAEIPSLAYIASILAMHVSIGGDFEKPLQKLADNLQVLNAQVAAARAEIAGSRGTALVLMLFAVVAAFINLSDPSSAAFYHSTLGTLLLVAISGWMVLGYVLINKLLAEVAS